MTLVDLFGAVLPPDAEALWTEVFRASNRILHHHKNHGFDEIEKVPKPNVHDVLETLEALVLTFQGLRTASHVKGMSSNESNQVLNAYHQLSCMREVARALMAKDRDRYEAAIDAMKRQAVV